MIENKYSYLGRWHPPSNIDYEVEAPETAFERSVHNLLIEGQTHLQHEEFMLALQSFRELQALILKTAHPRMPVDPHQIPEFVFPRDLVLVDTFAAKVADILQKTPVTGHRFPASLLSEDPILPPEVLAKINPIVDVGLQVTSPHGFIGEKVQRGMEAAEKGEWEVAVKNYALALAQAPATDRVLRGSLLQDLAILHEKAGKKEAALQSGQESIRLFAETRLVEAQVQALDTANGVFRRAGNREQADEFAKQANTLRQTNNVNPVIALLGDGRGVLRRDVPVIRPIRPGIAPLAIAPRPVTIPGVAPGLREPLAAAVTSTVDAPVLMGLKFVPASAPQKALKILGTAATAAIALSGNVVANVKAFQQTLADTRDLGILTGFLATPVQMVAYIPHIYFFVLPMAVGDCLAGLGNRKQAETEYLSTVPYPFINKTYEIVKLWTRLAGLYLEMGDEAYRRARDNVRAFGEARAAYENIVLLNRTLNANSPLYKDAKFAGIKTRLTNFLAAANPVAFQDNPAILTPVMEALVKLEQIQNGLNFFGFAPTYLPPFSFEYLQNTARYFAQQASQIEQRYIQYKSTAENEAFQREQLDQQAEVARQSVILEQRGVAEAQAGINVAQANLNYAEVQRVNAEKAKQDFASVRWELLELAEAEAWASAASVDEDDEIKQTWNGHYYSSSRRRRSLVLQDLAYQRTRISHDLEANKLQRAIDAANAYKAAAQAQLNQAQARKAVAQKRVEIAQLQQRQAEENRDFLDIKEFSARLWYELALQAKHLKQRYLDMATEMAFLMERAYNAETERNLQVIRYDYSHTRANNLMGADFLLADIDFFTLDYVTTAKTKKIPIKKTISLADAYAMAFQQLKTQGQCFFQTELADFDRDHPGVYLCKLRNVELIFVGITGATSIAGSLRNVGISKFRLEDGSVRTRLYPSDVMPLSQYEIRQDALAFRFNPNDLRLFENNGIDTLWQLELPLGANNFQYGELLDVQLVLYYDGFFSPGLEARVKATLPTTGSASRAFTMRLMFPDELFYLKNTGEAELVFDAGMFPHQQTDLQRTDVVLKVTGQANVMANLKLRLRAANFGNELVLTTNAQGEVNDSTPGQPLRNLRRQSMLDTWSVRITAADNPGLVQDGKLDLSGLNDVLLFVEYNFKYR
jgi:hypothetical protein